MDHPRHEHHRNDAIGKAGELAACPVMGVEVNKKEAEAEGLARTYENKTYYLCCDTCAVQFDGDPDKYAAAA